MFEVRAYSPLDEDWEGRGEKMARVVGWRGRALYTATSAGVREVDTTWIVGSFQEAQRLRSKLRRVAGMRAVVIRETITS